MELTAPQIHWLDEFGTAVNAALNDAIQGMRNVAAVADNIDHAVMTTALALAECTKIDDEVRQRISIGFIYALHRLGQQ